MSKNSPCKSLVSCPTRYSMPDASMMFSLVVRVLRAVITENSFRNVDGGIADTVKLCPSVLVALGEPTQADKHLARARHAAPVTLIQSFVECVRRPADFPYLFCCHGLAPFCCGRLNRPGKPCAVPCIRPGHIRSCRPSHAAGRTS